MRNFNSSFMVALTVLLFSCAQNAQNLKSGSGKDAPPAAAFRSTDPNHVTIAIVGMNDFHGHILPSEKKLSDGRVVLSGGAEPLYSMISILRKEMNGNVMIVDAGDEWQGTLESNQFKGETVVSFFNRLGVKVAAVGNHEFDFSLPKLKDNMTKANYPYVSSNILEKKTKQSPRWKNFYPSKMFEVDGIKVGVIGVATVNTPTTTRAQFVEPLLFVDPIKPVNEQSKLLKNKGAALVLVTAHAGTFCEDKAGLKNWSLRSIDTPQSKCDEKHEIYQLVNGIEPGAVDGVVAGHTHQIIHHWLNGVPVIQDETYNQYFNVIYYTFDKKTRKLIPELTRIEGLIPICTQVFEGLDHCDARRLSAGDAPKLVPMKFHGQTLEIDRDLNEWIRPLATNVEKFKKTVITTSELPMTHSRFQEGAMGNAMADALRWKAGTDFALVNSGGVRTSLDAGEITIDGIFRALPFDNLLNVIRLKGKDVKLLYRIATSGSRGITIFSGLKLKLIPYDRDAEKSDLDGNGRLDTWETNRLIDIKTSDGKALDDEKVYTIATFDFLVEGGDDVGFVMKKIPTKDIDRSKSAYARDVIAEYLKRFKVINTKENPLVDPKNPRVEFVKP